jgi:hypothetical protein
MLDLERALSKATDPATVHYDLALAHLAHQDRSAALASLRRAARPSRGTRPVTNCCKTFPDHRKSLLSFPARHEPRDGRKIFK